MPYLPVDLDGKQKFPSVAVGCGIPIQNVTHGFVEMWEMVWRAKRDDVTLLQLECLFGAPGERVGLVLAGFGFLENNQNGTWRVRGAEAWLRVSKTKAEAGSLGGRKTAKSKICFGNLKQNHRSKTPKQTTSASDTTEALTEAKTEALSSSIQHPASNKENTLRVSPSAPPPEPEYQKLVDRLFGAFLAIRGEKPYPRSKDWKALQRLRGRVGDDSEILVRWERGLRAQFKQRTDSFLDLDERWDSLTGTATSTNGKLNLGYETTDEEFRRKTAHLQTDENGDFIL